MATYVTDADLKSYLSSVLLKHTDVAELPSGAGTNVTAANNRAYTLIQTVLQERGFSKVQIDSWDQAAEFNRDIAVYWMLVDYSNSEAADLWVNKYDRIEELKTVTVLAAGIYLTPDVLNRRIGHGSASRPDDIFSLDTKW